MSNKFLYFKTRLIKKIRLLAEVFFQENERQNSKRKLRYKRLEHIYVLKSQAFFQTNLHPRLIEHVCTNFSYAPCPMCFIDSKDFSFAAYSSMRLIKQDVYASSAKENEKWGV